MVDMFFQKEKVNDRGENEMPTLSKKEMSGTKPEIKNTSKAGFYILGVSSLTAIIAGLVTSHRSKNKAKEYFKDLDKPKKVIPESPTSLAFRALAWATVLTVGVFSISVFGLWKWYDIKDMDDLRARMKKYIKKSNQSEGRTEFENLSDFLSYLEESSKK